MPVWVSISVRLRLGKGGAGWTGGGPIVDYYLPAFYADSAGVTVQIERIDAAGATCYGVGTGVETYTVPNGAANAQGVLALVNSVTARTFLQEDHPHQFGFLATAIGGGIHVGRCGLDLVNGAPPNTNFIASGGNEPVFSDFLPQGLVGAWCCVADSHGWCWPFIDDGAGSGGGGGATPNATADYINGALSNTAINIKTTKGQVNGYQIFNPDTVANFIAFYDALAANVTVGTTVPKFILPLAAGATANLTGKNKLFNTAISIAAASTFNGAGAPVSAQQVSIDFQ